MSVSIDERTAFTERIKHIHLPDPDSRDAYEGDGDVELLDGAQLLSSYWNVSPPAQRLHVIVQNICTFASRSTMSTSNDSQQRLEDSRSDAESEIKLNPLRDRQVSLWQMSHRPF
jgi:hypothetical protein